MFDSVINAHDLRIILDAAGSGSSSTATRVNQMNLSEAVAPDTLPDDLCFIAARENYQYLYRFDRVPIALSFAFTLLSRKYFVRLPGKHDRADLSAAPVQRACAAASCRSRVYAARFLVEKLDRLAVYTAQDMSRVLYTKPPTFKHHIIVARRGDDRTSRAHSAHIIISVSIDAHLALVRIQNITVYWLHFEFARRCKLITVPPQLLHHVHTRYNNNARVYKAAAIVHNDPLIRSAREFLRGACARPHNI
ncbi:unnamed protein product [Trichogramma brassicae]|uniref:Uncharacterized protein n=1 Tax=Trichogramma brassicae TaxID=86971 RepID=A0A6H5HRF5_9HYME|nr:unnamed protein product [Trichogramma brassicae]